MKKYTIILAAILLLTMPMKAERVTPETARKIASTFLHNNGAKTSQMADLSKAAGFPNLYIFTTEEGFVVMAADDCVPPILGYSLNGRFDFENMPINKRAWLQEYSDQIQSVIDNHVVATSEVRQQWTDMARNSHTNRAVVVEPLIQTKWDQGSPYNLLCPSGTVTGCVATAMAQVMKYWNYPQHGIGSHTYVDPNYGTQTANFQNTTYDWANMINDYSGSSEPQQRAAIATLMYHCGVSVEMQYGTAVSGGSGASTANVADALKRFFGYSDEVQHLVRSNYSDSDWITMLKNELNQSRPIQYHGSDSEGGHSFVCDGYRNDNYFHFNWGWNGYCDEYYLVNNLNPGPGGIGSGSNGIYNDGQGAVFGIHPSSNTNAPFNLTYTQSGRNVTLSWSAANGAASYNVYCNNNYIGNTTSTSYTHVAPYGGAIYYVRSMDANGALSLSSNAVTITIAFPMPLVDDLTAVVDNNVTLTWTAPDWCYPETPSATLTHGAQTLCGIYFPFAGYSVYWGHRHRAEALSTYDGMRLYSVDFYSPNTGDYNLCIYRGTTTNNGYTVPLELVYSQSVSASESSWSTIELTTPYTISGNQDLWIFIHNTEVFDIFNVELCNAEGAEGVYYSTNPLTYTVNNAPGKAFLMQAHLTDGFYTYNLYQDGTQIANNLSQTTYTANLNNNATNLFSLRTNYYGGETEASNKIGFTKGNASINTLTLNANDKMTVTEGSKLTVSGTLSDVNANNLILENGAQLVNNSANVKATVKKDITAYTPNQNDGWCLIASPMTENLTASNISGLLSNAYDLYTFNQSEQQEWRNYKAQNFTIGNKTGYLYANSGNPTLVFEGTLAANATATLLVYDNTADWKGFNLIGNPYPCNTYVDRSFYVFNGNGSEFTLGSNPIPPCTAILVQAQGTGESIVFSKTASKTGPNIAISIKKANTRGNTLIDQARVCFNEKDQLKKYTLSDQNGKLYIPQNDQDYAVAFAGTQTEIPVNFKATKNDTYTLNIETENLELDYLHLIDNMTGADIDLLATPNYTFEAKTSDYASRFKLVFDSNKDDVSTASEVFAYFSDGEIVVNNGDEATLQILDMTGRIIVCRDGVYTVSTSEMTPGVYVLRLINGDNVKTQKIIIE